MNWSVPASSTTKRWKSFSSTRSVRRRRKTSGLSPRASRNGSEPLLSRLLLNPGGKPRYVDDKPLVRTFCDLFLFIEGLHLEVHSPVFDRSHLRPERDRHADGGSREVVDIYMRAHCVIARIEQRKHCVARGALESQDRIGR